MCVCVCVCKYSYSPIYIYICLSGDRFIIITHVTWRLNPPQSAIFKQGETRKPSWWYNSEQAQKHETWEISGYILI